MKICHICSGYSVSFQGGITNYVRALAQSQQAAGNDVCVVTNDPGETYPFSVKIYASKKIRPFQFAPLVDKKAKEELKAFFEQEKFDLIHIHMMLDIDWDLYEVIKPYRYVVSLHDYYFLCPRVVMMQPNNTLCRQYDGEQCRHCVSLLDTVPLCHSVFWRLKRYFGMATPSVPQKTTAKRFEKFKAMLENADLLLPVSTRVQEIYENSGIHGNYRVLHIGNITADLFREEFAENRDKEFIDVVMLGTLTYIKGADLFVRLAKALDKNKFRVHFYGRSATYADKIREAGIIDHGPYNQAELPELLKNSDLGLVLSVWEDNGPQVVMEFLNSHVPVVGTRMGGIPDFVNEKNGFLLDPYSSEDFDRLVERLNALSREDIITLKRQIRPTKTPQEHARQIDEAYHAVLAKGN